MRVASHSTPCPTTSVDLYIAKRSSKRAARWVRMLTFAGRQEDIKGSSDVKEEALTESGPKVNTIATSSDSINSSLPIITADQKLQSRAVVGNSLAKDVEGGASASSQIEAKRIDAPGKSTSSRMTAPISSTVPKTDYPSGEPGSFTSSNPSLSAREKLRTARTLTGFAESDKPGTPQRQKNLLDALRESDKQGKTTKYGQPIEPSNLFDDRKRSTEKQKQFEFTWGPSQFFGLLSFVLLTSIMFGTTYIVWKLGAIHYNDL